MILLNIFGLILALWGLALAVKIKHGEAGGGKNKIRFAASALLLLASELLLLGTL
jgi:hypothetical protein